MALPWLETQTEPLPTTTPAGSAAGACLSTRPWIPVRCAPASHRRRRAQTESSPIVTLIRRAEGGARHIDWLGGLIELCRSDETCPRRPCATHKARNPKASPGRRTPVEGDVPKNGSPIGIDPRHRAVVAEVADPDRSGAKGDRPVESRPGCRRLRDRHQGRRPRPSSLGWPPTPHHPEGGEPRSQPRRARADGRCRNRRGTPPERHTGATGASLASGRSGRNSVGSPSAAAW